MTGRPFGRSGHPDGCHGMVYVDLALRALLSAVFVLSAASKCYRQPARSGFADAVAKLAPLVWRIRHGVAGAVTAAEAGIAVLLILLHSSDAGFVVALGVLSVFSAVVGVAVVRGRRVRCRCFGEDGTVVGLGHLARNATLMVVALLGLVVGSQDLPAAHADGAVLAVGCGILAGLVLTRWDDLLFLVFGSNDLSIGDHRAAGS